MHAVCLTLIQWKKDVLGGLKFMKQEIIVLDICQSFNHHFFRFVRPHKPANVAVLHFCSHLLLDQMIYLLAIIKLLICSWRTGLEPSVNFSWYSSPM